jgi:hypothetical protein
MASTTNWIRSNYYKAALIGIGVTTAVGLLYSLWSSKRQTSEDKIPGGKYASLLAKKMITKIQLQDGKISDDDLAALILTVREDANDKISALREKLRHEEEELAKTDAVVYAQRLNERF